MADVSTADRVIEVPERGESELRDAEQIQALISAGPAFEERRYFTLKVSGGRYYLVAGKYIGVIPVNSDLTVHIKPKVPTGRLIRILRLAKEDPLILGLLDRLYEGGSDLDVIDLLILALHRELPILFAHGPIRQYTEHSGVGQSIRGRPLVERTVTQLWPAGRFDQVAYRYFELASQNPLNQAIEHTLWHVSRLCRAVGGFVGKSALLPDFIEASAMFAMIEPDRTRSFLPRLNDHLQANVKYEPHASFRGLLGICQMILQDLGVDLDAPPRGSVRLPPMVVDMETVFQSFLFETISQRASHVKGLVCWNTSAEQQRPLLGDPTDPIPSGFELDISNEPAQPDFTIVREGVPIIVGDAKYKSAHSADDVYQALAHAAAYGAKNVLLVYPSLLAGVDLVSFKCLGAARDVRAFVASFPLESDNLERALDGLFEGILQIASGSPLQRHGQPLVEAS